MHNTAFFFKSCAGTNLLDTGHVVNEHSKMQLLYSDINFEMGLVARKHVFGVSDNVIVSQGGIVRNRYNQVPHLTQDINGKVTYSQLDTTNESQEVSPFPADDHKAHINRRAQRQQTQDRKKHKRSTKEVPPWNGQ